MLATRGIEPYPARASATQLVYYTHRVYRITGPSSTVQGLPAWFHWFATRGSCVFRHTLNLCKILKKSTDSLTNLILKLSGQGLHRLLFPHLSGLTGTREYTYIYIYNIQNMYCILVYVYRGVICILLLGLSCNGLS